MSVASLQIGGHDFLFTWATLVIGKLAPSLHSGHFRVHNSFFYLEIIGDLT